jgi:hypothetical protein
MSLLQLPPYVDEERNDEIESIKKKHRHALVLLDGSRYTDIYVFRLIFDQGWRVNLPYSFGAAMQDP